MSILEQLEQKYERPAYARTLNQFKRRSVAGLVGISTGYLCNVLTGSKEPSETLERRLTELARQVEHEQALTA